jgi:hypothetical protein
MQEARSRSVISKGLRSQDEDPEVEEGRIPGESRGATTRIIVRRGAGQEIISMGRILNLAIWIDSQIRATNEMNEKEGYDSTR